MGLTEADVQPWSSRRGSAQGSRTVPRGLFERLEKRREISLEEYELLHEGVRTESLIQPGGEFVASVVMIRS